MIPNFHRRWRGIPKAFQSNYIVPLRTHVMSVIHQLYNKFSAQLRKLVPSFGPNNRLWTSHATEAYLTITVHFIDAQWNLISRILQTCEMPEWHTSVNIASRLENAASEWNITDEHIVPVVSDNASNMRVAAEEVGWEYISCLGHTLQLAFDSVLASDTLTRLTAAAR